MPTTTQGLKKIAEGREAEIFAWEDGTVLRLYRERDAAAGMQREIDAMQAVRRVLPLVPEYRGAVEVMGRPGMIMERIDGPDYLTLIAQKPWLVWSIGGIIGDVHARLHDVIAPPEIESLVGRAHRRASGHPLVPPAMLVWAAGQLATLPDGDRLLHGDYHPANVLKSSRGPVVIDWPNVTRGNPDADMARTILMTRVGALPSGTPLVIRAGSRFARRLLLAAYVRGYRRHRPAEMATARRWVPVRAVDRLMENIPEEREQLLAIVRCAMAAPARP